MFYDTEVGNISQHEFCNEVRRIASCNVRDEDIVWAWNRLLTVIPNEKKVRLLELHDKGFRLFLLSNTNEMHWNYCAEELFPYKRWIAQDFFDEIYLSYELHKIKPQEDIFATVLADAGIKAEETLFIDDNEANIAAARELGIQTFWNEHPDDWLKI